MLAYTKPQQRKKEENERLRGERERFYYTGRYSDFANGCRAYSPSTYIHTYILGNKELIHNSFGSSSLTKRNKLPYLNKK